MEKSKSKSELASEYGVHPDTLMRWINQHPVMSQQLKDAGYKPSQKLLTPQQVGIIDSFLR